MTTHLTKEQERALKIASSLGKVTQQHWARRTEALQPNEAKRVTLRSLEARGLLSEYQGPRYMPTYELTDAGRTRVSQL